MKWLSLLKQQVLQNVARKYWVEYFKYNSGLSKILNYLRRQISSQKVHMSPQKINKILIFIRIRRRKRSVVAAKTNLNINI